MSELGTTILICLGIFAVVALRSLGRRAFTAAALLIPLAAVGYFAVDYLRDAPLTAPALTLDVIGVAIGAVFAAIATSLTGVELDQDSGRVYTRCGIGFLVTWFVAMAIRVAFVVGVEQVPAFRDRVGTFLFTHRLPATAIAPFFVLMALTMVAGRLGVVAVRAARLRRAAAATARTGLPAYAA